MGVESDGDVDGDVDVDGDDEVNVCPHPTEDSELVFV